MDARRSERPRRSPSETFRLVNNPTWHPTATTSPCASTSRARAAWARARSGSTTQAAPARASSSTRGRTEQKDLGEPAFSPDGRYVYFSPGHHARAELSSTTRTRTTQIYVIQRLDRQGRTIEPFVTGPGGAVRPVPSPDGKALAFVRRVRMQSTLFLKDLDTARSARSGTASSATCRRRGRSTASIPRSTGPPTARDRVLGRGQDLAGRRGIAARRAKSRST